MKKSLLLALLCMCLLCTVGIFSAQERVYDASLYGILPGNDGTTNSTNLQALIDQVSRTGGTIYIPEGVYTFSKSGEQTYGEHCIKMRSNVRICGAGEQTVLMPAGSTKFGLDMFYFNDYLDLGQANYLENCSFEDFIIDASGTACETYTTAGKGFMFNLIRNCHWDNVTVKNTDATGFGVDCPLDCSIRNCTATGCGKAAEETSGGASGFGIGYGFAAGEYMELRNCIARDNRKFGIFFEHQGRFDPERYSLENQGDFQIFDSLCEGNMYNFGAILSENVTYIHCSAVNGRVENVYFEDCINCRFAEERNE